LAAYLEIGEELADAHASGSMVWHFGSLSIGK
jgi:hypothetical protein